MQVITTLHTALVVSETVSLNVITPKPHGFIISGFNRHKNTVNARYLWVLCLGICPLTNLL